MQTTTPRLERDSRCAACLSVSVFLCLFFLAPSPPPCISPLSSLASSCCYCISSRFVFVFRPRSPGRAISSRSLQTKTAGCSFQIFLLRAVPKALHTHHADSNSQNLSARWFPEQGRTGANAAHAQQQTREQEDRSKTLANLANLEETLLWKQTSKQTRRINSKARAGMFFNARA